MAKELLVSGQLTAEMTESGKALVRTLDSQKLSIKGAFWLFLPEERIWRLFLVSPQVGALGPKAMYKKVRSAMKHLVTDLPHIGTKDISVADVKAPIFLLLRSAIATGDGIGGIRFSRNVINGQTIEDAYIYRLS
jgi:hypothetical protein